MAEYRVMHIGNTYQIQKKCYKHWDTVGECQTLESAKLMVSDLRGGKLQDA